MHLARKKRRTESSCYVNYTYQQRK
jgi:hypothetical protein